MAIKITNFHKEQLSIKTIAKTKFAPTTVLAFQLSSIQIKELPDVADK